MIEPRQIRAARALLNWSQSNLADASGVAVSSIKNIENNLTVARKDTIEDIRNALERAGVEFTLDGGVRPHKPEVTILTGREGFKKFFDVVYEEIKDGGEIYGSGVDEAQVGRATGGYGQVHIDRVSKIKDKVTGKFLLLDGDTNVMAASYCEYRWLQKEYYESTHFYIFNQKVAIISIFSDDDILIVIHDIPRLSEYYKKLFFKLWNDAKEIKFDQK
jgi:transcriptional regulator with XRE-family HTH domain